MSAMDDRLLKDLQSKTVVVGTRFRDDDLFERMMERDPVEAETKIPPRPAWFDEMIGGQDIDLGLAWKLTCAGYTAEYIAGRLKDAKQPPEGD